MKEIDWTYEWEEIDESLPVSFDDLVVGDEVRVVGELNGTEWRGYIRNITGKTFTLNSGELFALVYIKIYKI